MVTRGCRNLGRRPWSAALLRRFELMRKANHRATKRRCIAALQGAFGGQYEIASHGTIRAGDLFIVDQEDV
jgi:hypothetical protein